jgi:hypothetical protein
MSSDQTSGSKYEFEGAEKAEGRRKEDGKDELTKEQDELELVICLALDPSVGYG